MKEKLKKYIKIPPKKTLIIYIVSAIVLLAAFIAAYFTIGKELTAFVTDVDSFKAWLDSYKGLSGVIFVAIRAFQTVIKIIPAEPLEIASGFAFGTWGGLALCSLGTFLGSVVIVILSKLFGSKFISAFINEQEFDKFRNLSNSKNESLFLAIFYLIPGTPKDILTYIYASTKSAKIVKFFVITTICRIPSIITSTICGNQIEKKNITLAVIVFVATAVVSLICGAIYKKYEDKKTKKKEENNSETTNE